MPEPPPPLPITADDIVDTVREPLLVLGGDLRVRRANCSFYRTFRVAPADTEGRLVYELGDHQWDIPALRRLLEEILPQNSSFNDFEVAHDFPAVGRKVMLLNARRVLREGNHTESILLSIEDITERRRLEDERAELETRFTSLVKNIRDHSIFSLDRQGHITSWNREAERILGYSEAEALGRHFSIIFTPEDRQAGVPAQELSTAAGEGRAEDERWHVRRGGERFWALGIVTPTSDAGGRHTGYSKILRDMTDRRRAEEEAQFHAALVDKVGQAVIATEPTGRIIYWNRFAETLYGWSRGEAVGRNVLEVTVPQAQTASAESVMARLAAGESWSGEFLVRRRDGTTFPALVTNAPIRDERGVLTAIVGVSSDITDRKQTEEALLRSEQRFRALMEQAPFSIQMFSPDGRTIRVNRAWEELWGVRLEQIEGYNILEDRQLEDKGILRFVRQGFAGEFAHIPPVRYDPNETIRDRTQHADAARWVSAIIYPLKDTTGAVREVVLVHDDITARRRAEEDLSRRTEESEQQRRIYETALSNTADFNYVFDVQGRFVYVNHALLALWQKSLPEAVGKNFHELEYPPELAQRLQRQIQQVIETKTPVKDETPYTSAIGERQYEYIFMPVIGAAGEVEAVAGSTRDVTERKELERALQAVRRRLEEALTAGAIATWSWEIETDRVYADDKLAEWFSVTPEDAAGGPLAAYVRAIHPDDRERVSSTIGRAVDAGSDYEADYRIVGDGSPTRWVVARGRVERNVADVRPVRMAGVLVDISHRKEAELALRESERRYRAIGESIDYGVWVCDPEGRNTYASESFLRLVGLTQEECSSFGWGGVLHPDDAEATVAAWKDCVRRGGRWDREHRFRGTDGRWHYVLARGVPVRDERGEITAWVGINLDISRLKEVEEALRDADRRKDEFLATLAHELRNPLAPISNSLQLLKMPRVDAAVVRQTRDMMERQVHQLVRLVDDLLDVSRVMRGKIELRREPVELAAVVARGVETAQPLVEAQGHHLDLSLPPESLLLDADPVRLAQVVGNLLTNSAKYTEPNGHIWLSARREGGEAVLRVRDDGIGIAPDVLPHVFELFVQVDHAATRSQGGLGIGLTLVKNLVEMHGGTVEARSGGLGKGCEVVVRLPLVGQERREPAGTTDDGQLQDMPPSGHRLLVVDDNEDAAVSLSLLLRLHGHEVRVAHNGPTALELAASFRPHLVFLDIGMPGMDGYEVARRLRQQPGLEGVRLAALTGWGQQEDRRRTAEVGFDHHLVKPPEPKALEAVLAELKHVRNSQAEG